jgi:hypothetical protein
MEIFHMATTYNGYANYETWNVMLWLYNDEGIYDDLRRAIRPVVRNEGDISEVQSIVTRIFSTPDGPATPDGVWLDDKRIDWDEIYEHLMLDFR